MSDNKNPVVRMIAEDEIKDSMADARFYEAMPEFLSLKRKMQTMHEDLLSPHGCTNCQKNRVHRALGGDYLTIVQNLKDDGKVRLRRYFGADELVATVLDPATQKPKQIRI